MFVGAALSPDNTKNSDEIIKFTDIAMYAAKRDQEILLKTTLIAYIRESFNKGLKR